MKHVVLSNNKLLHKKHPAKRNGDNWTEIQHGMFRRVDSDLCSVSSLLFPDRYYISKGAIVDQLGGDLSSTPLHWAIRWLNDYEGICCSSLVCSAFSHFIKLWFCCLHINCLSKQILKLQFVGLKGGLGAKLEYNIQLFIFIFFLFV